MNWYKKSQFENPPEWDFPEASHDYDPAWDYNIDEMPDQEVVKIVDSYVDILKKQLLPQMLDVVKGMKIGYIKQEYNKGIAIYINGTAPWPVILINIEETKNAIKQYGGDIGDAIEMSILHEMGHAIQQASEMPFNEQQAEDFAFNYQFLGQLNKFWEE